jgi:tRNA-dihydrouridine synthase C
MEGVTEPCFRALVLARNPKEALGGAFTEFLAVTTHAQKAARIRKHLGPQHLGPPSERAPVGLQLMGGDADVLAETARAAAAEGAPLVDLNFGCPTPGTLRTCAGSALLREPTALERIVGAVVRAAAPTPVTSKIRAGFDSDALLEDLTRACVQGGSAMLTVHCRTRAEGYREEVDWSRIARAVKVAEIPVCGNGGVKTHADFECMRRETGCAYVMAGRAALADPWIFTGRAVSREEAARFLWEYATRLLEERGFPLTGAAARVKQLLHFWTAGGLVDGARAAWLSERDPNILLTRLEEAAQPALETRLA